MEGRTWALVNISSPFTPALPLIEARSEALGRVWPRVQAPISRDGASSERQRDCARPSGTKLEE